MFKKSVCFILSSVQSIEPQTLTIKMRGVRNLNGYFPEGELKYNIEIGENNRVKFKYIPTLTGMYRSADSIRFETYSNGKFIGSISMGGGYSNISNFKSDRQNLEQWNSIVAGDELRVITRNGYTPSYKENNPFEETVFFEKLRAAPEGTSRYVFTK